MKLRKWNNRGEGGQALVEFALVLSVLVVILFGIIEWGRLWMTANIMTSAAREGARVAAVTAPNHNQVRSAVQNILGASNIDDATVSIAGPNSNNEVTVTVQLDYNILTGSLVPGLNGTLELSRSAVMHWEG